MGTQLQQFQNDRTYAFENTGLKFAQPIPAVEAFERLGAFETELQPLQTAAGTPVTHQAIVRRGTDQRREQVFGVVSKQYQLISHRQMAQLWDQHASLNLTAIASDQDGKRMVLAAKLPTYDVLGDPVENYLLIINPLTGHQAIRGKLWPTRFYCTNQLAPYGAGKTSGVNEGIYLTHLGNATHRLTQWLATVATRFQHRSLDLHSQYTRLAQTPMLTGEPTGLIQAIYPEPEPVPANERTPERVQRYENLLAQTAEYRADVMALFQGAGTAMNTPATKGTAWGLLHAVTEYEDRRPAHRGNARTIALSNLFGQRLATKQRAYALITNHVG